ncbi:MAG: hypothetical protein ACE5EX_08885, partial [Phycisphaerae bacterium]
FCGQERVSAASFYHWRKQLRQQARRQRGTTPPGRFRPIAVVPAAPGLSIQLSCGARIEVRAEDLEAIRTIVAELARAQRDRYYVACPMAQIGRSRCTFRVTGLRPAGAC